MDIGKSFSYVFEDPRWVTKILIGGVMAILSILIVPAFILLGYSLQTIRNAMAGQQHPLPEWTDYGAYLADGFKLFVVFLIYLVPYIICAALANVDRIGPIFSCVGFIYSLAFQFVAPAVVGLYLNNGGDIGGSLQFQSIIAQVQANVSDYAIVFLMGIVIGIVGIAGAIACGIGLVFTMPYAMAVRSHLWAQLLNKTRGSSPVPVIGSTPL